MPPKILSGAKSDAERKRESRARKKNGTASSGRKEASFETRLTPLRSGREYQHELSPTPAVSPSSKQKLQQRRASRVASVRTRDARSAVRAAAEQSDTFGRDGDNYLVPQHRQKCDWKIGSRIFVDGNFGKVFDSLASGRYVKIDFDDGRGRFLEESVFETSCDFDGHYDTTSCECYTVTSSPLPPRIYKTLRVLKPPKGRLSLVDDTYLGLDAAGGTVRKTWRFRNVSFRRALPEGCILRNISGDHLQLSSYEIPLPAAAPREVFEVSVDVVVPHDLGQYQQKWGAFGPPSDFNSRNQLHFDGSLDSPDRPSFVEHHELAMDLEVHARDVEYDREESAILSFRVRSNADSQEVEERLAKGRVRKRHARQCQRERTSPRFGNAQQIMEAITFASENPMQGLLKRFLYLHDQKLKAVKQKESEERYEKFLIHHNSPEE